MYNMRDLERHEVSRERDAGAARGRRARAPAHRTHATRGRAHKIGVVWRCECKLFNHSNNSTEQKPRRPRALPSRFGVPARLLSPSVHPPRPPQGDKAAHITTRGKPPPVIKGGRSISNHVRRKIDISASPRCCSSTQPPPIHRGPVLSLRHLSRPVTP